MRRQRGVDHVAGLPVDSALGVVTGRVGQALLDLAVVGGQKDVETGVNRPHIPAATICRCRAGIASEVGGSVDDVPVIATEVGAGSGALAGGDQVLVTAVGIHDEYLVAAIWRARGLENQALAVGRPVGFGVLAAAGELVDIGETNRLRRGR